MSRSWSLASRLGRLQRPHSLCGARWSFSKLSHKFFQDEAALGDRCTHNSSHSPIFELERDRLPWQPPAVFLLPNPSLLAQPHQFYCLVGGTIYSHYRSEGQCAHHTGVSWSCQVSLQRRENAIIWESPSEMDVAGPLSLSTCCFCRFCQLHCPPWGTAHPTLPRRLWWSCAE